MSAPFVQFATPFDVMQAVADIEERRASYGLEEGERLIERVLTNAHVVAGNITARLRARDLLEHEVDPVWSNDPSVSEARRLDAWLMDAEGTTP